MTLYTLNGLKEKNNNRSKLLQRKIVRRLNTEH